MSGTSLDGVDAVAIEIGETIRTLASASVELSPPLRAQLTVLAQPYSDAATYASACGPDWRDPIDALGQARKLLSDTYAQAFSQLPADLRRQCLAIGAHGQTIRHRPELGFSLQILDGARLADACHRPVVCDFRSADIAAGGQGAPLVPAFHAAAFAGSISNNAKPLAVVNIGGIANASIITASGQVLAGFDTGPGNRLLDDWCQQHQHTRFDTNGQWAARGQCNSSLLTRLLADDYFARNAPKSCGREQFNLHWLSSELNAHAAQVSQALDPADVQATLAELTARSISNAITPYSVYGVLICGGGALNQFLMQRLGSLIAPISCQSTLTLGMDPQHVEGAAFAWLAMQRISCQPVDLAMNTGAGYNTIAGAVYLPPSVNQAAR